MGSDTVFLLICMGVSAFLNFVLNGFTDTEDDDRTVLAIGSGILCPILSTIAFVVILVKSKSDKK